MHRSGGVLRWKHSSQKREKREWKVSCEMDRISSVRLTVSKGKFEVMYCECKQITISFFMKLFTVKKPLGNQRRTWKIRKQWWQFSKVVSSVEKNYLLKLTWEIVPTSCLMDPFLKICGSLGSLKFLILTNFVNWLMICDIVCKYL